MRELVSVAPDGAELFIDGAVVHVDGLEPGRDYEIEGVALRTLDDVGDVRCVFATANDVHFGETVCGRIEGAPNLEVFSVGDGETPYPELMNRSVVDDIAALDPMTVVVKGDLTDDGEASDYDRFLDVWGGAFGDRLMHVRGNHDSYSGAAFAAWPCQLRTLPGVTLALLDTARRGEAGGAVDAAQLEWLDELGANADQPVVVLGHHPAWVPGRTDYAGFQGISMPDSARLVEVLARHEALVCYLAGHTHRNHRQVVDGVAYVEVACVKDFPGGWAEYRVAARGIAQVFHRATAPDAVAWAERTRQMFGGLYSHYAMGRLEDRSFIMPTTRG